MLQNKLLVFCCPFFRTFRVEVKPVNNASSLLLFNGQSKWERIERFSTDNSGEIPLKNSVAVNEIPSQDVENKLYMHDAKWQRLFYKPANLLQNRKCVVSALEPDHSRFQQSHNIPSQIMGWKYIIVLEMLTFSRSFIFFCMLRRPHCANFPRRWISVVAYTPQCKLERHNSVLTR